jgi:hypothetical protein
LVVLRVARERVMPKKKKQKADSRRQAAARLAAEAARREKHAAIVAERSGDPRFVQRVRTPTGYLVTPAAQHRHEMAEMFREQRERFREKFGRDPGPDDPVLFDPDADEPRTLDPDKMTAELLASLPDDTPPDVRAVAETFAEVGYLITSENQHTFSAEEVEVWERALTRRYEANGVSDAHYYLDDSDDDEETWGDVVYMAADALELAAGMVMASRDLLAADELQGRLEEASASESPDEEAPAVAEVVFAVFMGWMIGVRDVGTDPDAVLAWLHEAFGEAAVPFFPLMSILAPEKFSELGLDWTVSDMISHAGDDLIRGAVAISAAVAATAGGGDAHWLRQFDLDRPGE